MTDQPMIRSNLDDDGYGELPVSVHLELLQSECADTARQLRKLVAGRPQGTTTFLTCMALGLEQAAARLRTAWAELARPVVPWIVGSIPNEGKTFPATQVKAVYAVELEGELTPRGVQAIEQMVARADAPGPMPDAEGLAAARLDHAFVMRPGGPVEDGCWYDVPGSGTCGVGKACHRPLPETADLFTAPPAPGDRVVDLMAELEASVAAAKAARKARREVLEVPLQAGDLVTPPDGVEVWQVAEVLEDGRLILKVGHLGGRSGPWLPEGWERVE